eukprot:RCo000256
MSYMNPSAPGISMDLFKAQDLVSVTGKLHELLTSIMGTVNMTVQRADDADARTKVLEEEVARLHTRITRQEQQLTTQEQQLRNADSESAMLRERLTLLENDMIAQSAAKARSEAVAQAQLQQLNARLREEEAQLQTFSESLGSLNADFTGAVQRIAALEKCPTDTDMLKQRVVKVERDVADQDRRVSSVEDQQASINIKLDGSISLLMDASPEEISSFIKDGATPDERVKYLMSLPVFRTLELEMQATRTQMEIIAQRLQRELTLASGETSDRLLKLENAMPRQNEGENSSEWVKILLRQLQQAKAELSELQQAEKLEQLRSEVNGLKMTLGDGPGLRSPRSPRGFSESRQNAGATDALADRLERLERAATMLEETKADRADVQILCDFVGMGLPEKSRRMSPPRSAPADGSPRTRSPRGPPPGRSRSARAPPRTTLLGELILPPTTTKKAAPPMVPMPPMKASPATGGALIPTPPSSARPTTGGQGLGSPPGLICRQCSAAGAGASLVVGPALFPALPPGNAVRPMSQRVLGPVAGR